MAEDYKTRIVVEGDVGDAEDKLKKLGSAVDKLPLGLGNVVKGLQWVREGVSKVMAAFGLIGLALQGVRMLIDGFKWLKDKLEESAKAAKALREELANQAYATAMATAAANAEKLNKQLALSNELEQRRNEILNQRKTTERDLEDANAERDKQIEISKLDASDPEYDDKKKEIERAFEREASNRAAKRANEDVKAKAKELYGAAAAKDREAAEYGSQYRIASATEERELERSHKASMDARNGGEEEQKRADEAHERWKAAYRFAKKIKENMDAAQRDAASIRKKAGELAGGDLAAKIRNEANQLRISSDERKETADKDRLRQENEAKAKEEAEKEAKDEAAKQKAEEDRKAAQKQADEVRAYEQKANGLRGDLDKAYSSGQVSGNRLTAMGLGSGVRGTDALATDVHKMLDLMREQIRATKENKPQPYDSAATFSE